MKTLNLEFTKKEFLQLMKLVHIGEMVINGHKLHEDFDKKAEAMQDLLVKEALKNDIKDYLFKYKSSKEYGIKGGYNFSDDIGMDFFELLEESHDDNFSEKIVEIVSKNEIFSEFNEEEFDKKTNEQKDHIFFKMTEKVNNEFVENGYENLKINWNSKNPLFL